MDNHINNPHPSLEEIIEADKKTRLEARELVKKWRKK